MGEGQEWFLYNNWIINSKSRLIQDYTVQCICICYTESHRVSLESHLWPRTPKTHNATEGRKGSQRAQKQVALKCSFNLLKQNKLLNVMNLSCRSVEDSKCVSKSLKIFILMQLIYCDNSPLAFWDPSWEHQHKPKLYRTTAYYNKKQKIFYVYSNVSILNCSS